VGTQPLRRFQGVVAYDGTNYVGWQTQPSGLGVQDVLERRLSAIFGGRVYVAGSGRTDKGVHARGAVFHFEPPTEFEAGRRPVPPVAAALAGSDESLAETLERMLSGLGSGLPIDVQITRIAPAPAGFHARDSCVGKRYVYTVEEGCGDPFSARYRWTLGRGKRLDVGRMADAAAVLTGTHDFSTFGVRKEGDPRPPVKNMRRLEVRRVATGAAAGGAAALSVDSVEPGGGDAYGDGGVVTIVAECDRFLYNMMRLISGTLVEVGLGRLSVEEIRTLLDAKGRKGGSGGRVVKAPPNGLCLEHCFMLERDGAWAMRDLEAGARGLEVEREQPARPHEELA
jgi:tRNA pseudouridine38-40 synthase